MAMPAPVRVSRRDHLPQPRMPGQDEHAEAALAQAAIIRLAATITRCGRMRSANTPPTSGEHQRREDLRGEHVGQVGGGAGQRPGPRTTPRPGRTRTRRGQQPVGQQQPEVAVRQHREPAGQARPRHGGTSDLDLPGTGVQEDRRRRNRGCLDASRAAVPQATLFRQVTSGCQGHSWFAGSVPAGRLGEVRDMVARKRWRRRCHADPRTTGRRCYWPAASWRRCGRVGAPRRCSHRP